MNRQHQTERIKALSSAKETRGNVSKRSKKSRQKRKKKAPGRVQGSIGHSLVEQGLANSSGSTDTTTTKNDLHCTGNSEAESIEDWIRYKDNPSSNNLATVISAISAGKIKWAVILELMEVHFSSFQSWKVAQHLAMALSGQFLIDAAKNDIARASYYAHRAVDLSGGDYRARIVLAQINWERRVPLAVEHEIKIAEQAILSAWCEHGKEARVLQTQLGVCYVLMSQSRSYSHRTREALDFIQKSIELGVQSTPAIVQLLASAWYNEDLGSAFWAAQKLVEARIELNQKGLGIMQATFRSALISILLQRQACSRD